MVGVYRCLEIVKNGMDVTQSPDARRQSIVDPDIVEAWHDVTAKIFDPASVLLDEEDSPGGIS